MLAGVYASGGVSPGIEGAAAMILLMERQPWQGAGTRRRHGRWLSRRAGTQCWLC